MRRRALLTLAALAPACFFPDLSALSGDAGESDAPIDSPLEANADAGEAGPPVCDPAKPFSSVTPITELDDLDAQYKAALSADELEIWWGSTTQTDAGSLFRIYHATRPSIGSAFANIALEGNIAPGDVDPALSDDGLTMVYSKFGTIGSWDLFETTRSKTTDAFGVGFQLQGPIQSTGPDTAAFFAFDGSLWFMSMRSGGNHVWRAVQSGGAFASPVFMASLASPANDDGIVLTHDGLWAYTASNRTDVTNTGDYDMYLAKRSSPTTDDFGVPANVTEANSAKYERPNWISWDNCRLYFESTRGASSDLYVATKTP